ncbi:ELMO/CED-12 family-domain-containing protein [Fomitopsis serialis]|uniref:ELMO/CED-12 family-domain-containing protein n=1 Tax=Fomitopsis serialis TaxID=139415 RepID=UPI002008A65C|nr:ELMO/CED-12 family-domain-containing protein [Neoantrodia serialis]KAH9926950.1 ELMO/CED-12 family-domain-containing protein [Neoantrodia serialis]
MATNGEAAPKAAGTSNTNGNAPQSKSGLVPTNNVTIKDGMTVRTRIEPTLPVDDVIRQLCVSLQISERPTMFALRDESGELVTNGNLRKKIKGKVNLKLVNAPAIEAAEIVERLMVRDAKLGLALTSLRKYIKEEQFADEFLNRDGLGELISVINSTHGNQLAYALTAMQNLMELDHGWDSLDETFILKIVQIISSKQSLINVCRPATAILKKLVEASPASGPTAHLASSSKGLPAPPPGSIYRYGFDAVFEQMRKEPRLLETVVDRLGSADTTMALYSMMLINSLLANATEVHWDEFTSALERLNVRKAVIRLMSSHTIEDLTSCILDFQANMMRVTDRMKTTPVWPDTEDSHAAALKYIWTSSKVDEEVINVDIYKWRKIGLDSEDISQEFHEVGLLGLQCLRHFVAKDPDYWTKVVQEQLSRPEERRCPIAKASNEVTDLLSEHWAIYAPGYSTSTTFQPFFLNFYRVHALATQFFLRMWNESGASRGDFPRLIALARSQVKVALRRENERPWHEVEQDFLESEYRAVRDRQMKELEMEDDIMAKVPMRNLRAKLYKESAEFVRQQRMHCLFEGAWFMNGMPVMSAGPRETIRRPTLPWRFMRLDNSLKYLHYVDSQVKFYVRKGFEDLPDRIDLATVSEVATGTCVPYGNQLRDVDMAAMPASPLAASPLSFSLLTAGGTALADQIATDLARWADWTDGLNMLRRDGAHVASRETENFIQSLTEIGLKIKLLDLTGEKVDIPSGLAMGNPPGNCDFFFSDLTYDTQG